MAKDNEMKPIVESYNIGEEFLYSKSYLFIKGYATGLGLKYTLMALPLARKIHDGQYRFGCVQIDGKPHRLPYIVHCLKVCSTLISLSLPLSSGELDLLLASSILHDALENSKDFFPQGGRELVCIHGFPEAVFNTIQLLSKQSGASEHELNEYFNNIKQDKIALLVKLADRSHNVEDLYNMKIEKIHKYVKETRTWIYPLCAYGKANYPELSNGLTILKNKIRSLTELTETFIHRYEDGKHTESLQKK